MSATAQVCEIQVREHLLDSTTAQVLRFTPPITGDDDARHEWGVVCATSGVVDVFAMDPEQPGRIMRDESNGWVALLNCAAIHGPWTIDGFLASCGIEVVR